MCPRKNSYMDVTIANIVKHVINIILYITLRRITIPMSFLHPLNMQFKSKTNEKRQMRIFVDKLLKNCIASINTLMTS